MTFRCPDRYRVRRGDWATANGDNFGVFLAPWKLGAEPLRIIATDGLDSSIPRWEHVSVSLPDRCPTWEEMCFVKALFWADDDCVMQLHPPRADYVNNHRFCLHLWRPIDAEIPRPSTHLVGNPAFGVLA